MYNDSRGPARKIYGSRVTKNMIYIVGLGPGDTTLLPPMAVCALTQATVIVGYTLYVDMVPDELRKGKRLISTGMRQETDRANAALDAALAGADVAVVCSGDAGVYGMAGLVLELLHARGLTDALRVEVIPGIPAVCAAAALLGAPLMHDFACVSLSDLLTAWSTIVTRLDAALRADFVLALYNPRSKGRLWQLEEALALARTLRPGTTPVGVVRNAYRPEQSVIISTLDEIRADCFDMLSIGIIGNSATRRLGQCGQYMVTPRGYDISCIGHRVGVGLSTDASTDVPTGTPSPPQPVMPCIASASGRAKS